MISSPTSKPRDLSCNSVDGRRSSRTGCDGGRYPPTRCDPIVIVDQIRHVCAEERCELSARVRSEAWSEEEFRLWYRLPAEVVSDHDADAPDGSPFLVGMLLWCLRREEPLRIEGRVSPRLLGNVPLVTEVLRAFWPDLMHAIEVNVDLEEPGPGHGGTASFFTRGVDSWYSALTAGDRPSGDAPLTHLIYVPSVDFMYDEVHRRRAIAATEAAIREIGIEPVVVETNLREHTERFLHWGYYHGAGLASAGLALGFDRILLPAPRSYARLEPEGCHPLLDPLWSTARTEVVHHGAEATRWGKVQRLADVPMALRTLKVCFDENTDGNCGRCPKCLVTMTMLTAVGRLEECPFDEPLEWRRVARLPDIGESLTEQLIDEVLPALGDRRLAFALRAVSVRRRSRSLVAALLDAAKGFLPRGPRPRLRRSAG